MSEHLDKLLSREVIGPWQESCRNSFHPWLASPDLREKWAAMIKDGDRDEAYCAAIGLARCADLSFNERKIVEVYFGTDHDVAIEPHITLAMLLTGASPPTGFVSGFATYQLNTASLKNAESAKVWSMLSFIARHPSFPEFLDQLCDAPSITSDFFDYLRIAHPCCSVEGRAPHSNKWIRALQIFKAKYRGLIPQDALERFAYFMRVDFPRDEFARLAFTAENMLPDPFLSVLLQHPAILRGECQPFNPKNPHRNAIDYFSTNEPVCHAWRFYNPLLTYPWVFEMVNDGGVPEIYACMALVGSVLIGVNKHPVFERADFRGYFPDHPSCAMVLAYLGLR